MKKLVYLLFVVCMVFAMTTSVSARHIIWVSEGVLQAEGSRNDEGFITLLTDAGYEVTRFATPRDLDTQAKVDELNSADLVIMGRYCDSGNYTNDVAIGNETTLWNSLTPPLINMNGYLWRNSRHHMINSADTFNSSDNLRVVATEDPIFEGVVLDINNEVDIISQGVSTLNPITSAGNGELLATRAIDGEEYVWIARWETGTEYYGNAGQTAGGPRMIFAGGESGGTGDGYYNFTEAGKQIFLNAVTYYAPLTDRAYDPTPGASATQVAIDTSFSWKTAVDDETGLPRTDIVNHILYIGGPNDPNAASGTPIVITNDGSGTGSYTPTTPLERDAVYKWRVDEELSGGEIIVGNEWSFESIPSVPVISLQPKFKTLVDVDGEFTLTITATNPFTGDSTGLEYQWNLNDTAIPGAQDATLTVTGVDMGDEGNYNCVVKITANGATTPSESGAVIVKRLVQYHTFDGDLLDSVGVNDGTFASTTDPNAEPTFAPGFLGQAVSFDGDSYVNITNQGHPRAGASLEHCTISCWVYSRTTDGRIIGNFNNLPQDSTTGFEFQIIGGDLRCYLRDEDATSIEYRNGQVTQGEWHFVVVTWYTDVNGGTMSLYMDGKLSGTSTSVGSFQKYGDWIYDMAVGARNNRGNFADFINGDIDELKVYNYPLTASDVAVEYNTYTGLDTCVTPPALDLTGPGPDDSDDDGVFDPDCRVDLYDFLLFSQSWMECGLVPACL